MNNFDFNQISTPAYAIDEVLLEKNLKLLKYVQEESGAKIILALKGFACFHFAPLINEYLAGITASSLNEVKLGDEEFGKEVHVCEPAYIENEIEEIISKANHITFNSFNQYYKYKHLLIDHNTKSGLRINPEHSEGKVALYDPCSSGSRLGIKIKDFENKDLTGITGLHFHTLCEQNVDALERTLIAVEEKFGKYISQMEWMNFGGGHHITRPDYDVEKLISLIKKFKEKYQVEVYLEPGEAIALNTGYLVTQVLDIIDHDKKIALMDTSATAHMPDVLEMPYRPYIIDSGEPNEKKFTYTLGGLTCLAGDVIGDYSFDQELKIGDKLVFTDMAHYTMVKTTTFNGVNLPSIYKINSITGKSHLIKKFGYIDYKSRLS